MFQNIQIEKLNVNQIIVILALSISLLIAVCNGMNELSMSIASGFLGYIGGTHLARTSQNTEEDQTPEAPTGTEKKPASYTKEVTESVAKPMFTTVTKVSREEPMKKHIGNEDNKDK